MNIGELKEKIKNMSDDLPVVVSIDDGAVTTEYPLVNTYFNPECFILSCGYNLLNSYASQCYAVDGTARTEFERLTQLSNSVSDPVAQWDCDQQLKRMLDKFDASAIKRGVDGKITSIKEYRVLTGCGLLEAKNYVYKLLNL